MSGFPENKRTDTGSSQTQESAQEELARAYEDAGTGVFVGTAPDSKAALLEHLETSLAKKLDENVDLLQQLLEKEALFEQAQRTIKRVQAYVDECNSACAMAASADPAPLISTVALPTVSAEAAPAALPGAEKAAAAAAATVGERVGEKLAPFNPTMDACVDLALDMLGIVEASDVGGASASASGSGSGSASGSAGTRAATVSAAVIAATSAGAPLLYDLGCGDARLLVRACHRAPALHCIGIEYDLPVLERARQFVQQASNNNNNNNNVTARIALFHDNVLNLSLDDLCQAAYIFIYLVPAGMSVLAERLAQAVERGARVVTYVFSVPGLVPRRVEIYKGSTKLYLYCR